MVDIYEECFIKREKAGSGESVRQIWLVLLIVSLILSYFLFWPLLILTVLSAVMLIRGRDQSGLYEYAFDGETFTVTLVGQNRRKEQFSCKMEEVSGVDSLRLLGKPGKETATVYDFTSGKADAEVYCLQTRKKEKQIKVYFEPTRTMLDAMWRSAPGIVRK